MDRGLAACVAVLALAALLGQYASLPPEAPRATLARIWLMAGYFTVLTNALIAATLTLRVMGRAVPSAAWALALLVAIVMVSAVYHALLARLWAPQGLAWWADQGLHSAVPLGYAAWWLACADKRLGWRALWSCLAWPVGYGIYAMLRGALTGFWPYPFLDPRVLSAGSVALNLLALCLIFAAAAGLVIALSRRFSR